jgi:aminocarboxymuconate-semialdehyde decarboxylase
MGAKTKKVSKIKTIDVHAHIIPSTEVEAKYEEVFPKVSRDSFGRDILTIKGQLPFTISKQLFDVNLRLQEMDKTEVDMQALSIMPPMIQYELESSLGVAYCRMQNDSIAQVVQAFPNRFVGLANVPLQIPREAANELERTMKDLGMKGAQITGYMDGKNLDAPELWPFYEKAEELGAFLLYHPRPPAGGGIAKYHLRNLVGLPFATSLAIASLIFGGVLKDFPRLKICFAHAGGFAPYQRGRWEHGYQVRLECKEKIQKPPSEYFKLLFFDTVTHYIPALEYLIRTAGGERVLLGSDYPFDMADADPVGTVSQVKCISAREKRKILAENALEIFGMSEMGDGE